MVKIIVTFDKDTERYAFKVRQGFYKNGYEILKHNIITNEVRNAWEDYFFATEDQAIEMVSQWISKMSIMNKIWNIEWHI